jgi:MoaA/NifB/PqqE/SkfB family radical SAM enzyme
MTCAHCCYSCNKNGKHADYDDVMDMINFLSDRGEEYVTIGGGEPTMHPRFFDILKECLNRFDSVWMVTNGSKTKSMFRLSNIIDGNDVESFDCTCGEEDCICEHDYIYQEGKLTVALSQDGFHDPIDERIVKLWSRNANQHRHTGYEIRTVDRSSDNIVAQGRAKKNGYYGKHCVCSTPIIKPNGKIRLCGCTNSPVIGDVWEGIDEKWDDVICNNEGYQDVNCYKGISK